ncbi:hypothetical protein niasHS_014566 [Heterodera schachtii]|uniref:Uncharacterized protein n=1 Tax=Heterodera schachtii TaxID=97005 RepID=A0ABD2IEZ5_HETSC
MHPSSIDLHSHGAVGICAVCGDRADGHHYGVLSCRGCNAFFRRAVTFNLQFHCRRDGHCDISKNARCACRACRLLKCQSVGMDRSAVQVRREMKNVLDLGNAQNAEVPTNSADFLLLSPTQSDGPPFPTNSQVLGSGKTLDLLPVRARLLGSAASVSSPLATHSFDRLIECYFRQRYRRQKMFCQTAEQILSLISSEGPTAPNGYSSINFAAIPSMPSASGTRAATTDDLCQVRRVETLLMFEWVDLLEEFKRLEMEPMDKARLLRSFAPRFLLLDFVLHSLECHSVDCLLLPNGAALISPSERNSNDQFGCQGEFGADIGHRAMGRLSAEAEEIVREVLVPLAHNGVTFGELIALRLLLLWDCAMPLESVGSAQIVRMAAERTRKELAEWLELHSVGGGVQGKMDTLFAMFPILCAFAAKFAHICRSIANFHVMPQWQFMADLLDE